MLPYGLAINASPDAYWLVPVAALFSFWVLHIIIIYIKRGYFFRTLLYVASLFFNFLVIFTQLFFVYLPVSDNEVSMVWYILIGLILIEWAYTSKIKKISKNEIT